MNTTSAQTMRRNVANTQAIISYDVTPSFISNNRLETISTLNHAQVLKHFSKPEWTQEKPTELEG